MCENPVTRVSAGLPRGYALQRGPAPDYRWYAKRISPTEYCLVNPDSPNEDLSFATLDEGIAWFASQSALAADKSGGAPAVVSRLSRGGRFVARPRRRSTRRTHLRGATAHFRYRQRVGSDIKL